MLTTRIAIVVLAVGAPLGTARGQNPSPVQSAPPPLQSSLTTSASGGQPSYAPAEAHGYRYAGWVSFGDTSGGVELTYKHNTDAATVYVTPYDSKRSLQTEDDTMALLQGEVARVRDPLELAAQNQTLDAYYRVNDRADGLHVGNQTIRYYWYFAQVQRRGERGVYLYYAAYATSLGLVRVRAELPWLVAAHASAAAPGGVNTGAGVVVIEGAGAASNQGNRNSSRSLTTAAATATSDAGPFREQLTSFGNEFVQYMVTHPPTSPSIAAVATEPAASGGAAPSGLAAQCSALPPATDTLNYRVYAALEAPARKDSLPSGYIDLVLDALRHGLVVPNPLGLTVYAPMVSRGAGVLVPAVYGEIEFTLDQTGKLSDTHLTQSSLSPALDQSLYDAPRRADSLQAFPSQIGVTNPGPIRFYVAFSPFAPRGGHSMAMFAVRMPAWRPGTSPGIDAAHDVKPVFPITARAAGVSDSVTIQFVVDERGAPVQRTVRLLKADHIEYAQAVMEAVLGSQYVPAMAAGCPVKGLVERQWKMTVGQP